MTKKRYVFRSSITGRYVSADYAAAQPDTTVREEVGPVRAAIVRAVLAVTGG